MVPTIIHVIVGFLATYAAAIAILQWINCRLLRLESHRLRLCGPPVIPYCEIEKRNLLTFTAVVLVAILTFSLLLIK